MVAALLLWLALLLLLRTLRLNRELRRLSEHDALTGALNHRACQLAGTAVSGVSEHGTVFSW
jgi:GGDEF domain-containing protein